MAGFPKQRFPLFGAGGKPDISGNPRRAQRSGPPWGRRSKGAGAVFAFRRKRSRADFATTRAAAVMCPSWTTPWPVWTISYPRNWACKFLLNMVLRRTFRRECPSLFSAAEQEFGYLVQRYWRRGRTCCIIKMDEGAEVPGTIKGGRFYEENHHHHQPGIRQRWPYHR